jgi:hypothetical protein
MFTTLLKLGATGWTIIIAGAVILIFVAVGILRKIYPEKERKPLKRM